MGVTGLLPQLKEIQEPISLEKFRGRIVAIDSYAWLHKGVFSCAWELAQDQQTNKYLSFFKKRIALLRHFDIVPYFVFDGDHFGNKQGTESGRAQNRQINKEKGMVCLQRGDKKAALAHFSVCVDVTPSMAKTVIDYLKTEGISYVVAPYEADAQMVYLEKRGLVDAIISEDSDLLIFGAQVLLTKLNEYGECIEIRRENFKKCRNIPIGLFSDSQLRIVACLSGCDYTNGVPGVGIVTAFKLVKRISSMKRCLMNLRLEGKRIPKEFEQEYARADLSFQYQRVFDPISKTITTLNEISELDKDNDLLEVCIGPLLDHDIHLKISIGELDPITKEPLLSREASLLSLRNNSSKPSSPSRHNRRQQSQPLLTQLATQSRHTPLKSRSLPLKAPVPITPTMNHIDTFFKTRSTESKTSVNFPTPKQESPLSPTSKRRKLFENHVTTPQTSSRFFMKSKDQITEVQPTINEEKSLFVEESQSDGELTDIDLEDDNGDHDNTQKDDLMATQKFIDGSPTKNPSEGEENIEYTEYGIDVTTGEYFNSSKENLADTQQILDDLNTVVNDESIITTSVERDIRAGLFERFGFKAEDRNKQITKPEPSATQSGSSSFTDSKRIPLKPLQNFDNKIRVVPGTTLVKNNRSFSRNLTLDSFIYRG